MEKNQEHTQSTTVEPVYRFSQLSVPKEWREELEKGYEAMRIILPDVLRQTDRQAE